MPLEPDILEALVRTIEIKDLCTAAHTWRVVMYSRTLAERVGVDHDTIRRLSNAAALHDLGKIDIPDEILRKPGALSDAEYAVMKTHTVQGWERLKRMGEDDELLLAVVRSHHEHVDGRGYPDGLKGEAIHVMARIFAVVDSFDAMTSVRPYHAAFGKDAAAEAISRLRAGAGTQFCPHAVDLLADAYADGALDWILANFNDHVSLPTFAGPESAEALSRRLRGVGAGD